MQRYFRKYSRRAAMGLAAVVLAASLAIGTAFFLYTPPGNGDLVRLVDLARGESLKRFADELEKGGVLASSRLFVIYARLTGADARVQAGTYRLTNAMAPVEILRLLVAGQVYEQKFAVPEGYSVYQLAELLEGRGYFKKEAFLKQCFNRNLLQELGIPGQSVEGYLYPSTYDVSKVADEAALIRTMVGQFNKVYGEKLASRERGSGLSRHGIVTLASIIEKEAVVAAEQPLIASVFRNRLRLGMPLQSDPTAVYGVRAFAGKVSHRDIERDSPYNTYRIKGLPPGPIGNPGSGAMAAALTPAKTGYLYFVAKLDGAHYFSGTLAEHNRAVKRYLKSAAVSPGTNGSGAGYRNDYPNLTGRR